MKKEKKEKKPMNIGREIVEWILYIVAAVVIAAVLNVFIFQITRVDGNSMVPTLAHGDLYVISKLGNVANSYPDHEDMVVVDSRLLYLLDKDGEPIKSTSGDIVYYCAEEDGNGKYVLCQTDSFFFATDNQGQMLRMTKEEDGSYTLDENDRASEVVMHKRTIGLDFYEVFRYNAITGLFTGDSIGHVYYVKRVIGLPGDVLEFDGENGTVTRNGELLDETYINQTEFPVYADGTVTVEDGYVYVMGDNRNHSKDSRMIGQIPVENVLGTLAFKIKSGK